MTSPLQGLSVRQVRVLLLAVLLPFAAVMVARWNALPSPTDGDYAHYLLHAKALAESRPYTDIGYIYTEMNLVGPRAQPPGWPIVLAPFVAVFGTHSPVFKLLVSLLVAAFGVTAGAYFLRRGEIVAGLAVAAVVPLALETDYATSSALSDPLFCVLVWATLLVADDERPIGWGRAATLTLLAAAALTVRVAGIAVIPALVLHAVLREREGRIKLMAPLLVAVAGTAVFVWKMFEWVPFLDRSLMDISPDRLVRIASSYRSILFVGTLYPFASDLANDIYHGVLVIPILIGAVRFFRAHYRSALACFIVAYVGILIFAPVRDPRYAWPLAPLVIAWMVHGTLWIAERIRSVAASTLAPRVVAGIIAAVVIGAAVQLIRQPPRPSLLADPDTVALFDWMRATGDTAAVRVVFTNPRVLTLETEVPAMGIPFGTQDAVIAEFGRKRITHVVVQLRGRTRQVEDSLAALVGARPSQFSPVYTNATYDVRRFHTKPVLATDGGFATTSSRP